MSRTFNLRPRRGFNFLSIGLHSILRPLYGRLTCNLNMLVSELIISKMLERQRGPIVIDNEDIPTSRGIVNVLVDKEAFREYIIKKVGIPENDKPVALDKIDQLVIAFGKRSFREVVTDHFINKYIKTESSEEKAIKLGRRSAVVTDKVLRLLRMGFNHTAIFDASNESPFLYFNLPYILRKQGDKAFYDDWVHELSHLSDYLKPKEKAESMRHQKRMYITTGAVALATFVLFEKAFVEADLSIENPFWKIASLAVSTGVALFGGAIGGIEAHYIYYNFLHKSEKKAEIAMTEQSEARDLVKLIIR